ncbi:MAG: glycosyltransferase [Anaeromyxobacter sp.]
MTVSGFAGLRVAFVCDSLSPEASGGLVARRMISALVGWGAQVHALGIRPSRGGLVPIPGAALREVAPRGPIDRSLQHFLRGPLVAAATAMMEESAAQVVHLASLEYAKPRFILEEARRRGARVVVQPWVHNFYCEQGYDLLGGGACGRCAGGAFHRSWASGCAAGVGQALLHGTGRVLLRRAVLQADAAYSTNTQLDSRLRAYGLPPERIVRGPLPFPGDRIEARHCEDGEEFVFHGQAKAMKGFPLLGEIVRRCSGVRFGIYPLDVTPAVRQRAGLAEPLQAGVRFDGDIRWSTGLAARVARARGVLLPSVWPSTTEYALLEALGWAKPVIAFDVGVNRDILVHRENAMVVPAGDVDAYAAAIRELDADPALRRRVGAGGRRLFDALTADAPLATALAAAYGIEAG